MSKVTKYLNQLITGNVFDAPEILDAYSIDRSIIKITPKMVALPESTEDIQKLMRFFYELVDKDIRVPIAIRGSGLDEMGADLTSGVVLSTEKLNKLMEIDTRERLVRVQAGITLKELNTALSVNGLTIPIDANENDTIGSIISNYPRDSFSGKYGGISQYVKRAEIVLSNGECIQTGRLSKYAVAKKAVEKTLEGEIYQKLYKLNKEQSDLVKSLKDGKDNRVGYSSVAYISHKDTMDILPIFFGAEGTLGVISEVILSAVPIKKNPIRTITTFVGINSAIKFANIIADLKPRDLNIYDIRVLKQIEKTGKNLDGITKKMECGFAVSASFDEKALVAIKKLENIKKTLPRSAKMLVENIENRSLFDEFENSLIYFLNHSRNGERVPLLADFSLPNENLSAFVNEIEQLEEKLKLDFPLFGSYVASNYSLRPKFKIDNPKFKEQVVAFLRSGTLLIKQYGGELTGGSPEGRVKALITNVNLPKEEKELHENIKEIFDPKNILNPDIKLGTNIEATLKHFRTSSPAKIVI